MGSLAKLMIKMG